MLCGLFLIPDPSSSYYVNLFTPLFPSHFPSLSPNPSHLPSNSKSYLSICFYSPSSLSFHSLCPPVPFLPSRPYLQARQIFVHLYPLFPHIPSFNRHLFLVPFRLHPHSSPSYTVLHPPSPSFPPLPSVSPLFPFSLNFLIPRVPLSPDSLFSPSFHSFLFPSPRLFFLTRRSLCFHSLPLRVVSYLAVLFPLPYFSHPLPSFPLSLLHSSIPSSLPLYRLLFTIARFLRASSSVLRPVSFTQLLQSPPSPLSLALYFPTPVSAFDALLIPVVVPSSTVSSCLSPLFFFSSFFSVFLFFLLFFLRFLPLNFLLFPSLLLVYILPIARLLLPL